MVTSHKVRKMRDNWKKRPDATPETIQNPKFLKNYAK